MYSKYLFAQSTYTISKGSSVNVYEEPHTQNIMFFLDEISIDNFKYAWSMFKHYQLQGEEQYVFVFYPRKKDDVTFVKENFISTLKSGDKPIADAESKKSFLILLITAHCLQLRQEVFYDNRIYRLF